MRPPVRSARQRDTQPTSSLQISQTHSNQPVSHPVTQLTPQHNTTSQPTAPGTDKQNTPLTNQPSKFAATRQAVQTSLPDTEGSAVGIGASAPPPSLLAVPVKPFVQHRLAGNEVAAAAEPIPAAPNPTGIRRSLFGKHSVKQRPAASHDHVATAPAPSHPANKTWPLPAELPAACRPSKRRGKASYTIHSSLSAAVVGVLLQQRAFFIKKWADGMEPCSPHMSWSSHDSIQSAWDECMRCCGW